ncbi:MAG: hypothetical protein ACLP01_30140 [Solirubrobacteraceae bacterium]
MSVGDDSLELDLLAASLRAGAEDLSTFVESLATKLEDAVGSLARVERGRQGIRGPKLVRKIAVEAGGDRLELVRDGANRFVTRRARVSGGIVLKTETLDIDAWLQSLSEALASEASRSERTRQALQRLLLG